MYSKTSLNAREPTADFIGKSKVHSTKKHKTRTSTNGAIQQMVMIDTSE